MSRKPSKLEQLLDFFGRAGMEPTAEEVADLLWLAARLPTGGAKAPPPAARPHTAPPALPPEVARPSLPPARGETFGPSVTASVTGDQRGPATADLYPVQAGTSAGGTGARTIRSPAAFALPGGLELGRSLRPLKRRVPSRSHLVLDEASTAHHIADTDDWTPVFKPAPERWLDVILLVDESSSMVIWHRTMAELENLLKRQGAFRNVGPLGFRASPDSTDIQVYSGIGPAAERSSLRRSTELIDPLGRRLIAVVSDCVAPIWHNGVMAARLSSWGQVGLVTVIQVLPNRLWVRTGLRTCPAIYLRSPSPGAPNSQFEIEWTTYRPKPLPRGTAVPVVSLEAQSLAYWARAVAGNSNLWIPGVFTIPAAPVQPQSAQQRATAALIRPVPAATADQLVSLFYGTASPTARRLASILAAVPLTLPVIRLVAHALLPESRQVHLAEVWLSGLIDRPSQIDDKTPADNVEYFFVNGVRELLLNNLRLSEVVDVLSVVSGYVGERLGQALDFAALIADPAAGGELQLAQGYQAFARVAAGALHRFGGQYADLAQRLELSVYGQGVSATARASEIKIEGGPEGRSQRPKFHAGAVTIRALLVGTNEHAAAGIATLNGAVEDVLLTEAWLRNKCGVNPADIQVLLNRDATKKAIVDAWHRLASQMKEGDQLFFHFSGRDQQIASSDPNEADGLEETLFVYDSISGDRATLLTHQELADLATELEQQGGQAIILLDSCRMASGLFSRRALGNTLVFAGAAEAEEAYETELGGKTHGAVTFFLAEAMQAYKADMTWLDAHDHVLANVRAKGFKQTPQLIGAGELTVFGLERKLIPPYLLVIKANDRELEVLAPAGLGLGTGEKGARLAIYPPASAMDQNPIGFARVQRTTESGVAASVESSFTAPLASRVRVLEYGDTQPFLRVGMDDELRMRMTPSSLVAFERDDAGDQDLTVSIMDGAYVVIDRDGRIVWRDPAASDSSPEAHAGRIRAFLEHVATYLRTFALENRDAGSELAGAVEIEVVSQARDTAITLAESEPLMLRLRNRSAVNLYISVWMLDETLAIQRIYPATTPCVMLGQGREVQLAVAVRPYKAGDRPMRMTFKVFASAEPADLGLLALPGLDPPVELAALIELPRISPAEPEPKRARRKTAKAGVEVTPEEAAWVPGGPVAVTAKVWKPGITLRVKFLKGEPVVQKKVMKAALEWTKYANLRFEVVTEGDAELRVDFEQGASWSYIGNDSLDIPQNQPTINLGGLTPKSTDEDIRPVVIHEFGHALGLAASQQSPVAAIPWDRKAAYEYYAKLGWDRQTVDYNVFSKLDPRQVIYGPADPYSIMYHQIPKEATGGKMEIMPGNELSEGDKQLIAQLYPRSGTKKTRMNSGFKTSAE